MHGPLDVKLFNGGGVYIQTDAYNSGFLDTENPKMLHSLSA
jgi:hypothetical protein